MAEATQAAVSALDRTSVGSDLPAGLLDTVQAGVFQTVYRGVPFLKSPFDIAIYLQLLWRLKPKTVIEVGAKHGGSALWFADMMAAQGIAPRVLSVDIELIVKFTDPRITFIEGDAKALEAALPASLLDSCEGPFLVVEDSSHRYEDCTAVLSFFHDRLKPGDYIIVEDGVLSQFADGRYAKWKDGPNRAVRDFVAAHPGGYEIDASLCDHFGRNITYNPNGWLRRL